MENNRVLTKDLATIKDLSFEANKYGGTSHALTAIGGQTKLLIGSRAPFNHIYMKLGTTVNLVDAKMSAEYWNGSDFVPFVDLNDRTESLKKTGFVYFTTDKDEQWTRDDTDMIDVTGSYFGDTVIYDRYWMQLSFDVDLTPLIDLNFIGQKFSDDNDLAAKYPGLIDTCMLEGFQAGKTDWDEQAVLAASEIIDSLIDSYAIKFSGNVLDPSQLKTASVHKVAAIIYTPFGKDYRDDAGEAGKKFFSALNKLKPRVDKNNDGRLNPSEARTNQRFMNR